MTYKTLKYRIGQPNGLSNVTAKANFRLPCPPVAAHFGTLCRTAAQGKFSENLLDIFMRFRNI